MCPFCTNPDKPCLVTERPDGRLACACGRHSWPNVAAFVETCRTLSLTQNSAPLIYTQSY
jgi:hypothetical protein